MCRQSLKELVDLLVRDQSQLGARPLLASTAAVPSLDSTVQRHLTHFSLVTHGFGSPAIVAAITAVQNYLNELLKCVERSAEFRLDLAVQWRVFCLLFSAMIGYWDWVSPYAARNTRQRRRRYCCNNMYRLNASNLVTKSLLVTNTNAKWTAPNAL